jgi:hypothetical protein
MKTLNKVNRGRETMDPEKIVNGISKEIFSALETMEKAKTPEEKLMCSEIIKNLCNSLEVFFGLMDDIAPYDDENEPIPF